MRSLRKALDCVDGHEALGFLRAISSHRRLRGTKGFESAARFVAERLAEGGIAHEFHRTEMDGERAWGTFKPPAAWDWEDAELRLKTPRGWETLQTAEDNPLLAIAGSAPTKGYAEAEVADVGEGTREEDYAGRSVEGKVVLARGHPGKVHGEAVAKRGALGVLSEFMPSPDPAIGRSLADLPDTSFYSGIFSTAAKGRGFALAVTHRCAERLRAQRDARVRCRVACRSFASELVTLHATLPGRSPDGLLFVAHLCHPHPGANDNASGAALLLETALAAKRALGRTPRRTLHFLWVAEMYGTMASVEAGRLNGVVGGVNLDMVGENQLTTRGPLRVEHPPLFSPSVLGYLLRAYLDDAFEREAENPHLFSCINSRFRGGSDHYVLSDPTVGVPSAMLIHWPDRFYHSSDDTPDKASASELYRVGVAATAVAHLFGAGTVREKRETMERAARAMPREEPWQQLYAHGALTNALRLGLPAEPPPAPTPPEPHGRVYRRRFKGPLLLSRLRELSPSHGEELDALNEEETLYTALTETVFGLDGKRTLGEVTDTLEGYVKPFPRESVERALEIACDAGLLEAVE